MAVRPSDAVRAEVLVGFDEMRLERWRPPRAGDTRLAVGDDRAGKPARSRQRRQAQDDAGGIAARIGDQAGPGDLRPTQLRKTVDGLAQQLSVLVRVAVP